MDIKTLLHKYIEEHLHKYFEWGVFDCCTFVNGWIRFVTNVDFMKETNCNYKTKLGSARTLKRLCDGQILSIFEEVTKHLPNHKIIEITENKYMPGDLVAVETEQGTALGLYASGHAHIPNILKGIVCFKRTCIIKHWRVVKCQEQH